jgi:phage/plasmid primase-like uncharacterized protein
MIPAIDIERARSIRIEDEIARRNITLKLVGAERIGPCPVCGGRDRFSINIRKQVFNCRGAVGGDVIDLVQHLDGCDFVNAVRSLIGDGLRRQTAKAKPEERDGYKDDQRNLAWAEAIWRETLPLGRDAIAYFARRSIDINQVPKHGGLRFHPRCPWRGGTEPCIIGRFTTALGDEPRGILRRPITGEKAITLGPMSGCVIRLWPDEVVEQHLVLGEGVETVLSMALHRTHRGKLLRPAWAVCVANNLKKFPILSGIEILTVLVDNDLPDQRGRRAGQEAAAKCAARWSEAGREVIRLTPNVAGTDFNDLVMS